MKKILSLLPAFFILLLPIGCLQQESKIVAKKYDQISTNYGAMKKVEVYENINALEWLNDHQIIEKRQRGLYLFDLQTKETKLLYEDPTISLPIDPTISPLAAMSPDKKHLFFQSIDGRSDYYILNLATKKITKIDSDYLFRKTPNWVENKSLIYANSLGEILLIQLNGKVTKINHKLSDSGEEEAWYQIAKAGDQFFYVKNGTSLWVWNQRTNKTKQLMENANEFIVSPDKKQLAVVTSNYTLKEDNESLILMDLFGQVQSTIATGQEIRNVVWSDDANKLAYNILKTKQLPKLYVMDQKNSRATLLAINLHGDSIAWNPAGTILFINQVTNPQQPNQEPALYMLTSK
jgi:Tol biopolymer transport system component